jgi:transposase
MDELDPRRLVFVDEMGTHTSLAPVYAYATIGERAFFKVPRNRGRNTTLVASLHFEGMGPSMAVEGATTREVFEVYVEHFLGPALRPGQIVVMDNLGAHRPQRVRKLIEERGCELLFLPPYSPELNPIEEAFSRRSRTPYPSSGPERKRRLWKPWAGHWMRLAPKMRGASLPTAATVAWCNTYESCCQH